MSTTITEYGAREARAIELIPQVEAALTGLDGHVVDAVKLGAELGQHLEELAKRHKGEEGSWLVSICPNRRVTNFAAQSAKLMRRNAALDDPSQLTFALLDSPEASSGERPSRADGTDTTALLGYSQKLRLLFAKWGEDKVDQWPQHRRDAVVRAVLPLVELLKRVQCVDSHD
jgi:hypothetical protein